MARRVASGHGPARQGTWFGRAWPGLTVQGSAWHGMARHGMEHGLDRPGWARLGMARLGAWKTKNNVKETKKGKRRCKKITE